jgi:hypothetical protein
MPLIFQGAAFMQLPALRGYIRPTDKDFLLLFGLERIKSYLK